MLQNTVILQTLNPMRAIKMGPLMLDYPDADPKPQPFNQYDMLYQKDGPFSGAYWNTSTEIGDNDKRYLSPSRFVKLLRKTTQKAPKALILDAFGVC